MKTGTPQFPIPPSASKWPRHRSNIRQLYARRKCRTFHSIAHLLGGGPSPHSDNRKGPYPPIVRPMRQRGPYVPGFPGDKAHDQTADRGHTQRCYTHSGRRLAGSPPFTRPNWRSARKMRKATCDWELARPAQRSTFRLSARSTTLRRRFTDHDVLAMAAAVSSHSPINGSQC